MNERFPFASWWECISRDYEDVVCDRYAEKDIIDVKGELIESENAKMRPALAC